MTSFIRSTVGICLGIGLLLAAPGVATAAGETTVAFTSTVTVAQNPDGILCFDLAPGDVITGTYTYDSKAPDANGDPNFGQFVYGSSPNGMTLRAAGQQKSTSPSNFDFELFLDNG